MSAPKNSKYYRTRAKELRQAAQDTRRSFADRDTLRVFADDFERFADEAEKDEQGSPRKAPKYR